MKLILAQIWAMVAGSLTTCSVPEAADGICTFAALFPAHLWINCYRDWTVIVAEVPKQQLGPSIQIQVWVACRASKYENAVPGICHYCETSMNTESAQALILHPRPSL
jgi:hypothetical protein